jgi:shikimate dehydrogenase
MAEAAAGVVRRFRERHPEVRLTTSGNLARWLTKVDGVVHVTPMGMAHHPGVAFAPEDLASDAWVAEVVYRPLETELVRRARAHGLATLDGGMMAVNQAVDSIRLITGLDPDRDRMLAHFHQLIGAAEQRAT